MKLFTVPSHDAMVRTLGDRPWRDSRTEAVCFSLARSARLMSPGTSHLELITTLPYPTVSDPSRGVFFGKTYRSHLSV